LTDTYLQAHPKEDLKASGTMHGFSGRKDGARIDHVLTSPAWETDSVEILHAKEGLWPSDHFPVRWKGRLVE
jgi:endonuclease/exonuclease/phosphatase family metal-dependent hydrolase